MAECGWWRLELFSPCVIFRPLKKALLSLPAYLISRSFYHPCTYRKTRLEGFNFSIWSLRSPSTLNKFLNLKSSESENSEQLPALSLPRSPSLCHMPFQCRFKHGAPGQMCHVPAPPTDERNGLGWEALPLCSLLRWILNLLKELLSHGVSYHRPHSLLPPASPCSSAFLPLSFRAKPVP